jgi:hypothetical protein
MVVISVITLGCATPSLAPIPNGEEAATLRREIAARVSADQEVQQRMLRAGLPSRPGEAQRDSVFKDNLQWMRRVLEKFGWPGRRLVGEEGSHGAWLLLQHADLDPGLQRLALPLLEQAVRVGDASGRDLAYLTDRVRTAGGELQVYGTQLQYDDRGCASPKPTEDPARLDKRRAQVGLEPMARYLHDTMEALGRAGRCPA